MAFWMLPLAFAGLGLAYLYKADETQKHVEAYSQNLVGLVDQGRFENSSARVLVSIAQKYKLSESDIAKAQKIVCVIFLDRLKESKITDRHAIYETFQKLIKVCDKITDDTRLEMTQEGDDILVEHLKKEFEMEGVYTIRQYDEFKNTLRTYPELATDIKISCTSDVAQFVCAQNLEKLMLPSGGLSIENAQKFMQLMGQLPELRRTDKEKLLSKVGLEEQVYRIKNLHELPIVEASGSCVVLRPNEVLHYCEPATRMWKKKVTTKQTKRERVVDNSPDRMFGFKYQGEHIEVDAMPHTHRHTEWNTKWHSHWQWIEEGEGTFWITNKRVGFTGNEGNSFSLYLNQVSSISIEKGRIQIFMIGRNIPFAVRGCNDDRIPCAIISTLVKTMNV